MIVLDQKKIAETEDFLKNMCLDFLEGEIGPKDVMQIAETFAQVNVKNSVDYMSILKGVTNCKNNILLTVTELTTEEGTAETVMAVLENEINLMGEAIKHNCL